MLMLSVQNAAIFFVKKGKNGMSLVELHVLFMKNYKLGFKSVDVLENKKEFEEN